MKDDEIVQFTAGELRAMADICPEAKNILKQVRPEVLGKDHSEVKDIGQVFLNGDGNPYISHYFGPAGPNRRFALQNLSDNTWWSLEDDRFLEEKWLRPMRSGVIQIRVRGGRAVEAQVKEDSR